MRFWMLLAVCSAAFASVMLPSGNAFAATAGCGRAPGENLNAVVVDTPGFASTPTKGHDADGVLVRVWADGLPPWTVVLQFSGRNMDLVTATPVGKADANGAFRLSQRVSAFGSGNSSGYFTYVAMGQGDKPIFQWSCAVTDEVHEQF